MKLDQIKEVEDTLREQARLDNSENVDIDYRTKAADTIVWLYNFNTQLRKNAKILEQIAYLADGARVENAESNNGEERRWLEKLYELVGDNDV